MGGCGSKLDGEREVWKSRPVFQDWNLDAPPATDPGDLSEYRRVRDEIKAEVEEMLKIGIEHLKRREVEVCKMPAAAK